MTDIPGSAREFERWFAERKSNWPRDASIKDLMEFARLYGEWNQWKARL